MAGVDPARGRYRYSVMRETAEYVGLCLVEYIGAKSSLYENVADKPPIESVLYSEWIFGVTALRSSYQSEIQILEQRHCSL
jgi:hypothetical protein